MKKIIVLCTGNRCRSQMAHGYLKTMLENKAEVFSAGSEPNPKGVHPLAIELMREEGIDISDHSPKSTNDYKDVWFDLIITVCDNAKESCVLFTNGDKKIHRSIEDPDKVFDDSEEERAYFQKIRNEVKTMCEALVVEFEW